MRNVTAFLNSLAKEGEQLEELAKQSTSGSVFIRRYERWQKSAIEIMEYASLHQYAKDVRKILDNVQSASHYKISRITGLIESACDVLENGFVGQIKFLLHSEVFATMIGQARALLEAGHLIPAAVLGRIIVENWLQDQAESAGIAFSETARASAINDSLKKAEIFSVPKWRQVQACLDLGNAAAHGQTESFSREDIERLLAFLEVNCI